MSDAPVLGIDLGTTNSVVAVADGEAARVITDSEGNRLIPSVVAFHPGGEVLVGYPARERRLLDARNTIYSVKRLLGRPFDSDEVRRARERFPFELAEGPTGGVVVRARGESYSLPEISSFVLKRVRAIAEESLGMTCTRAVVTVPANFNELQRSATKAAGRIAGLDVLRILNEPTAAALAHGYGRGSRERIAVYDLGGGTFDLTILDLADDVFEVVATAGDSFLGGDDIDVLIADQMAAAFLAHHRYDPKQDPQAYERLRAAAEWAKCQLSAEGEVQLKIEELAYDAGGRALDLVFALTRDTLERIVRPLIARTFDVCEDAMRVAGIRPSQLDNIVLVGGSTRTPLVRSMVKEYFAREPLTTLDPDLAVAQGAAIQGRALAGTIEGRARKSTMVGRVALKRVTGVGTSTLPGVADEEARVDDEPTRIRRSPYEDGLGGGTAAPAVVAQPAMAIGGAMGVTRRERKDNTAPYGVPDRAAAPAPALPDLSLDLPASPPDQSWDSEPTPTRPSAPAAPPPEPARRSAPPPLPRQAPQPPRPPAFSPDLAAPAFLDMPPTPAPPRAAAQQAPPRAVPQQAPPRPAPQQAFAPEAPQPMLDLPLPAREVPLLLDVTPHSLGIETVGGFCEHVVRRNATIPVEQSRVFTTGADGQTEVEVRICQGESRRLAENQELGTITLSGIRPALRGEVKIAVTFVLDADGTLGVSAKDLETGREQQVRISLVGAIDPAVLARRGHT